MRTKLTLLAVAVLALTGCASSPGTGVAAPDAGDLDGSWELTSGTDTAGTFDLDGVTVTLEIDDDRASGTGPCNSYMGDFQGTAVGVDFDSMGSTRMACSPDSLMKLETRYLAALEAVDTATIDGDTLTLSLNDDPLELVFTAAAEPESVDLVGPTWTLETITTGDTSSGVEGEPTLVFGEDGTLHGTAGCRGFTGDYVHDGDESDAEGAEIALTQLEIDHSDCPAEIGDQETLVFDVIGQGFTATVAGDVLTVTRTGSNSELVYRADDTEETAVGGIDGEWQLTKASDADGAMTINGAPVTLVVGDGSINGQAPCNTYTGEAAVDGTDITIGTIAQTLMACVDDARTQLETRYLAALQNVTTSAVGGGALRTLTLSGPDVTLKFTVIEKKAAN